MVAQIFQKRKNITLFRNFSIYQYICLYGYLMQGRDSKHTYQVVHSRLIIELHSISAMCRFIELVSKEKYTHC
jgi:hypothetical protein